MSRNYSRVSCKSRAAMDSWVSRGHTGPFHSSTSRIGAARCVPSKQSPRIPKNLFCSFSGRCRSQLSSANMDFAREPAGGADGSVTRRPSRPQYAAPRVASLRRYTGKGPLFSDSCASGLHGLRVGEDVVVPLERIVPPVIRCTASPDCGVVRRS